MLHPLGHLSSYASIWILGGLMLLTILWGLLLGFIGQRLKTSEAPGGMISFEVAFTAAKSEAIVRSWQSVLKNAKEHLLLGYVFIPLYSTTLTLLCVLAGHFFERHHWSGLGTLAAILAWYQWVAGALAIVEYGALLKLLSSTSPFPDTLPWLAGCCALFRFFLIILALVCFLVALASTLLI